MSFLSAQTLMLTTHWRRICCPLMRSKKSPLGWSGSSRSWSPSVWVLPRRTASPWLSRNGYPSACGSTAYFFAFIFLSLPCIQALCCSCGPAGALLNLKTCWHAGLLLNGTKSFMSATLNTTILNYVGKPFLQILKYWLNFFLFPRTNIFCKNSIWNYIWILL